MNRPRRAAAWCVRGAWRSSRVGAGLLLAAILAGGCGKADSDRSIAAPVEVGSAEGESAMAAAGSPERAQRAGADDVSGLRSGTILRATSPATRTLPAPAPAAAAARLPLPTLHAPPSEPLPTPAPAARLAIVIDDVGWSRDAGMRVIALPGPLTLAVLPGTPRGAELSRAGYEAGHEIILHQPMAPLGDQSPGPGALLADSSAEDIARIVAANLAAVPHRVGLSNHMGSLLTSRPEAMQQLMAHAAADGIYFLDSRTTAASVALDAARSAAVPSIRRDLFLDDEPDPGAVEAALDAAVALAEQRGHAVAIGHPRPDTLMVLERRLTMLGDRVRLVPVSALVTTAPPPPSPRPGAARIRSAGAAGIEAADGDGDGTGG